MNVLLKRRGDKYIAVYRASSELKVVFQREAGKSNVRTLYEIKGEKTRGSASESRREK